MKLKNISVLLSLILGSASASMAYNTDRQDRQMERFIDSLMSKMTIEEKVGQINLPSWDGSLQTGAIQSKGVSQKIEKGLVGGLFNVGSADERIKIQTLAVKNTRLGIPLIFGQDVIHGHRTIFPIPLALACSWDMELIERTARAAATEASADGIDWVFSPMVDIARDPRWGRVAEGSGEDAYLGSRIAEAMVRGYQHEGLGKHDAVMACVKHFALYGAGEGGRDYDAVDMSVKRMSQDYLPPYKAAIDAGAGSVMTSFNDINGVPATANKWLLTDLLRGKWGFSGFVVSDYTAVGELSNHGLGDLQTVASRALAAGLDMDMVSEGISKNLTACLKSGNTTLAQIDRACRRVLEAKYKLGLFNDPFLRLKKPVVDQQALRRLALDAARKAIVLLKNDDNILPLKKAAKIALVGPLADNKSDLLGTWVLSGDAGQVVSVKEGAARYTGNLEYAPGAIITDNANMARVIRYDIASKGDPDDLLAEALAIARDADVVVAVMGETRSMSGESTSMVNIDLQRTQKRLLEALVAAGKDVVLVLVNGRPLTLEWEHKNCKAIVEAWAPGTEGGNAIADVLFGAYNPSGKLAMSFPVHVGQIPIYHSRKPTGRPHVPYGKYTNGYIDCLNEPLYPFGYGLSYNPATYSDLRIAKAYDPDADTMTLRITLTNNGSVETVETPQLYVGDPQASESRPVKELKAFKKIALAPGEVKEVDFVVTSDDLKFYDDNLNYIWEPGTFIFEIGPDSKNTLSLKAQLPK